MTNEEPLPSTSSVLSAAAEKNVKIVNGSKKRKGLDIDALWRKKFKDVENEKSPEKPSEEVKKEDEEATAVVDEKKKVEDVVASVVVGVEKEKKKEESDLKVTISPETRSTRSARKRLESQEKAKKMEDTEDVKPNIKLLKKAAPGSGSHAKTKDGNAEVQQMLDPNKISLHNANYGEESQDEMEVMQNTGDDPNGGSQDGAQYEFAAIEYPSAVTPNGGPYTIYTADSNNYATYYQPYSSNMQSSPQDGGSYLLVPGSGQSAAPQSPQSIDDDGVAMSSNTRASPATISWLLENYEAAEGSSLPRCQLYDHYRKHCSERRLDPVNAASFGKLIRSVFLNLKTRRLGTRGNSKYHYYGIRIKDSSTLNVMITGGHSNHIPIQYACTPPNSNQQQQQQPQQVYVENPVATVKYVDTEPPPTKRICHPKDNSSSSSSCRDFRSASPPLELQIEPVLHPATVTVAAIIPQAGINSQQPPQNYVFTEVDRATLGKLDMPHVPFRDQAALTSSIGFRKLGLGCVSLKNLIDSYSYMCREVLNCIKDLRFTEVEQVWTSFWSGGYGVDQENIAGLCSLEPIQEYIIEVDLTLYQTIVDILVPNVLLSEISVGMMHSSRTFGKNIDVYLKKALMEANVSEGFVKKKIQAIKYMQQGLKRYTSLNHLAHAARGVLQKQDQVNQMYLDYLRVDINTVHSQAGWICRCDSVMVHAVNNAFKANLQKMSPMESWAEWLESIVDQVLAKYHNKPVNDVANVGKQFLLNWSFYTSMIIRDLTLRSAQSFGSFTLIRLLADDYMYYLIESKIAKAGKQQLITVIRQDKDWPLSHDNQEYIVPGNDEDLPVEQNGLLL